MYLQITARISRFKSGRYGGSLSRRRRSATIICSRSLAIGCLFLRDRKKSNKAKWFIPKKAFQETPFFSLFNGAGMGSLSPNKANGIVIRLTGV